MNISGVSAAQEVAQISQTNRVDRANTIDIKGEKFALSTSAKDFQSVKKLLSEMPDVRQNIVEEVKQRIEGGNYDVSSYDVADKISRDLFMF